VFGWHNIVARIRPSTNAVKHYFLKLRTAKAAPKFSTLSGECGVKPKPSGDH